MTRKTSVILAICMSITVLGFASSAHAKSPDPFMLTTGATSQPIGHYEFCQRNRAECRLRSNRPSRTKLTPQAWNELVSINASVNRAYVQTTDLELFGRVEVWTYPLQAGDCEDLALQKRRLLMERGWPVGALLVTVARQANGEGHAVLTVLTDRGDLVLDNLEPRVLVWNTTNLHFVKRQSEFHTGRWTSINDDRTINTVGSPAR
ncbi:MAG: transglutaminase-like cysteine peptidase [Alphaproteobacteria bacterium]